MRRLAPAFHPVHRVRRERGEVQAAPPEGNGEGEAQSLSVPAAVAAPHLLSEGMCGVPGLEPLQWDSAS